jgi:iodotyrosine deiodinase
VGKDGQKIRHYYVQESVGIATGMLITAVHNAGLVSLTHTPSPMNFLNDILKRPNNERPYLILVVGYPRHEVTVPDIEKKKLKEIATFV